MHDQGDRAFGIRPKWHDLNELIKQIKAYSNKRREVYSLYYKLHFIEMKEDFDVRLTKEGREYCGKRIRISSI